MKIGRLLGAAVLIMLFIFLGVRTIPVGIHDWRTEVHTQSFVVATAPGVTTADVVLTYDPFLNQTDEISSIASTLVEVPVATTYVTATNTLTVSALTANTSRTLTVTYYSEVDDDIMRAIGPFLLILIFLFFIGATLYFALQKGGRR